MGAGRIRYTGMAEHQAGGVEGDSFGLHSAALAPMLGQQKDERRTDIFRRRTEWKVLVLRHCCPWEKNVCPESCPIP